MQGKKRGEEKAIHPKLQHLIRESLSQVEGKDQTILKQVLEQIDRARFCPSNDPNVVYGTAPCPLTRKGVVEGKGATLSALGIHVIALQLIMARWKELRRKYGWTPFRDTRVLDVGSGSGYLCIALSHLMATMAEGGEKRKGSSVWHRVHS